MIALLSSILIAGLIVYALLHVQDRPGLFAGVTLSTYAYATYFGSVGGPIGLIALLLALAELARQRDRPPLAAEAALGLCAVLAVAGAFHTLYIDQAQKALELLVASALSGYLYGRAFGHRAGFWQDMAWMVGFSLILSEPGFLTHLGAFSARLVGNVSAAGASFIADVPIVACITVLILDPGLRSWQRAGLAALLFLVLLPVSLSFGTRGTFFAAVFVVAVAVLRRLLAPQAGRFALRFGVGIAAVFLAGAFAFTLLAENGANRFLLASSRIVSNFAGGSFTLDSSSRERIGLWHEAIKLIGRAPWFGHGPYAFGDAADDGKGGSPHNIVLEVAVSLGFVGLAVFLAGVVPITIAAARRMFARPLDMSAAFGFCLLVDILVRLQLSASLFNGRTLYLALGMAVANAYPARGAVPVWRETPSHDTVTP
jgi:O-antigen ligase